jgi:hypothetical protein
MTMKRGNWRLSAVLVLAAIGGCTRTCYMTEADLQTCSNSLAAALPRDLETNPHDAIVPAPANTPKPTTVNDTDRPIRYMTLAECITIGLQQGNIGSTSPLFPGIANDSLVAFNGQTVLGSDSIRVLSYDQQPLLAENRPRRLDAPEQLPERRPGQFQHRHLQAVADRRLVRHHVQHRLHVPRQRARRQSD